MEPWQEEDRRYTATLKDEKLIDMQYALDEAKSLVASAIDGIKEYYHFSFVRDALEGAMKEIEEAEKEQEEWK